MLNTLWLLASAWMILVAIFLAILFWQTSQDSSSYYLSETISLPGNFNFVTAIGAFAIFSYIFLRTSIPDWLSYLTGVVTVRMLLGFIFVGGKDLPHQPLFLISLVAGFIFLIARCAECQRSPIIRSAIRAGSCAGQ